LSTNTGLWPDNEPTSLVRTGAALMADANSGVELNAEAGCLRLNEQGTNRTDPVAAR